MKFRLKILIDTREKETKNIHIKEAFKKNNIEYIRQKLSIGDYSAIVIFEDGKQIDISSEIVIERKQQLAEISNNLTKDNGKRFINELEKAKNNNIKFNLLIEDSSWYEHLLNENYMYELSLKDEEYAKRFNPKHNYSLFINRLMQLKHKYNFDLTAVDKTYTASFIYRYLYGYVRQNSYRLYRNAK